MRSLIQLNRSVKPGTFMFMKKRNEAICDVMPPEMIIVKFLF